MALDVNKIGPLEKKEQEKTRLRIPLHIAEITQFLVLFYTHFFNIFIRV